jgi:hypothetical protein
VSHRLGMTMGCIGYPPGGSIYPHGKRVPQKHKGANAKKGRRWRPSCSSKMAFEFRHAVRRSHGEQECRRGLRLVIVSRLPRPFSGELVIAKVAVMNAFTTSTRRGAQLANLVLGICEVAEFADGLPSRSRLSTATLAWIIGVGSVPRSLRRREISRWCFSVIVAGRSHRRWRKTT